MEKVDGIWGRVEMRGNTERFSDPSSFGGKGGIRWPKGVRKPKSGDPLYVETMAAVYGYVFNGVRYRLDRDGKPVAVEESGAPPTGG